MNIIIINSNL